MTTSFVGSSEECSTSVAGVSVGPGVNASPRTSSGTSVVGISSSFFILPRILTRATVKKDNNSKITTSFLGKNYMLEKNKKRLLSMESNPAIFRNKKVINRRDFGNELIKKLNAKRFLKHIYKKSERSFGATLRHYQVKK